MHRDDNPLEATTPPVPTRVASGLAKIGQAIASHASEAALQQGLTLLQGQILAYLASHPSQGIRLLDIATALTSSVDVMQQAMKGLCEKGLVHVPPLSSFGTAGSFSLTQLGAREAALVGNWPAFLSHVVETLQDEEQVTLLSYLIKTLWLLQEQGAIPVARMCISCQHFRPHVYADPARPHHCALVNEAFGDRLLRIECPEYAQAGAAQRQEAWKAWNRAR